MFKNIFKVLLVLSISLNLAISDEISKRQAPVGLCPLAINPCQNNGICVNTNGNVLSCVCINGFTGIFCQDIIATTVTPSIAPITTTLSSSVSLCPNQAICQNQGVCYIVSNAAVCVCPQGFAGSFCEIIVSTTTTATTTAAVALCPNQNVCQNLGVCYIVSGASRCVCPQGFTGTLCESISTIATTTAATTTSAVTLCANQNTCQNLGVCYLISGVTRCVCPQGFTGSFCEISSIVTVTQATTTVGTTTAAVALCANQNTCQNLGVCYLISGVTRCVCPQGFTGTLCETALATTVATTTAANGCAVNPCINGGSCVTQTNGVFQGCFCRTGYIGRFCETLSTTVATTTAAASVTLCPNQSTCQNQGVCYLVNGAVRCVCPQGFTGTLCESRG